MRAEDSAHHAPVVVDRVRAAFGLRQLYPDGQQVIRAESVKDAISPGRVGSERTLGEALPDLPVVVQRGAAQTLLHGAVAHERIESQTETSGGYLWCRPRVQRQRTRSLTTRRLLSGIRWRGALPRPCGAEHFRGSPSRTEGHSA